ncbi:MAG TPA: DUF4364 family protein [Candidatus Limiplasma sp.]|nr:DUF4364 family protein [Candidatus Limiplasma sp.]HRX08935.1 DUF4364 family protein [Candidatus Limiplasma sp.]
MSSIKPAPRNISETEYMLTLLRCVDVLGYVTDLSLWTFAAELELMDYVTMRLCLHKLLASKQVEYGAGSLKNHVYLTGEGRQALKLFGERIPTEIADKMDAAAPAFRERISLEQQVRAAYESATRGDYRLSLSVMEGDLTMLHIRMQTKSRRLAGRAIKLFEAQAPKVLTYLFGLAQDAQRAKPPAGKVPGEIVRHSATEYEARHMLPGKKAQFDLALALPTEEAAKAYLAQFVNQGFADDAAEKLCRMICNLHIL